MKYVSLPVNSYSISAFKEPENRIQELRSVKRIKENGSSFILIRLIHVLIGCPAYGATPTI